MPIQEPALAYAITLTTRPLSVVPMVPTFASLQVAASPSTQLRLSRGLGRTRAPHCHRAPASTFQETKTSGLDFSQSTKCRTLTVRKAPDIVKVDDLYYLYYSVSEFGSQNSAIGVARSSSMDVGSWTDLGSSGVRSDSSKAYNAIDANLFKDGNTWRMYFGSWWKGLFTVAMKSPPTGVASGAASANLINEPVTTAVEAPYLFKYGSYYYMFYSQGKCCGFDVERPAPGEEYKIMVCRSSSATGAFVDKNGASCTSGGGTVVLESHGFVYGAGHQGVYDDPEHGPVSHHFLSALVHPTF